MKKQKASTKILSVSLKNVVTKKALKSFLSIVLSFVLVFLSFPAMPIIAEGETPVNLIGIGEGSTITLGDTIKWEAVSGADYYWIKIWSFEEDKVVDDQKISGKTKYVFPKKFGIGDGTYRFWIAAYEDGNSSPIAQILSICPKDGKRGIMLNIQCININVTTLSPNDVAQPGHYVDWKSVSDIEYYKVFVRDFSNDSVIKDTVESSDYTLSTEYEDGQYRLFIGGYVTNDDDEEVLVAATTIQSSIDDNMGIDFQIKNAVEETKLSGKVTKEDGSGFKGVTIKFSINKGTGNTPESVTTDSSGNWEQKGFSKDCRYSITPQKTGYTFSPYSLSDVWGNNSSTGINFVGTPEDTIAPTVKGTSITKDAAIQGSFDIIFSEKIYEGTKFGNIKIAKDGTVLKNIEISIARDTIFVRNKDTYWGYDTTYTVTIPVDAVKDGAGNLLSDESTISYTTEKDTTIKEDPIPKEIGTLVFDEYLPGDTVHYGENLFWGAFDGTDEYEVIFTNRDTGDVKSYKTTGTNFTYPWSEVGSGNVTIWIGAYKDDELIAQVSDLCKYDNKNGVDIIADLFQVTGINIFSGKTIKHDYKLVWDANSYVTEFNVHILRYSDNQMFDYTTTISEFVIPYEIGFGTFRVWIDGYSENKKIASVQNYKKDGSVGYEFKIVEEITEIPTVTPTILTPTPTPKTIITSTITPTPTSIVTVTVTPTSKPTSETVITQPKTQTKTQIKISNPIEVIPAVRIFKVKGIVYRKYFSKNVFVSKASIKIEADGKSLISKETSVDGEFNIDVPNEYASYKLTVNKEGFDSYSTIIYPENNNSNLVIEIPFMQELYEVKGIVINKYSGDKISGAEVYLDKEVSGSSWKEVTDADGWFCFRGVGTGTHSLKVIKSGYVEGEEIKKGVQVKNENVNLGFLKIINMDGFIELSGKVTDKATNRAISEVKVNIKGSSLFEGTTDEDGMYHIYGVADNSEQILEFQKDGYLKESLKINITNQNSKNINFTLKKLRTISGHVYEGYFVGGGSTNPIKGATVWLNEKSWTKTTVSDGKFIFEEVAPAEHALFAKCKGYKTMSYKEYESKPVNVTKGDGNFNLYLVKNENFPDDWAKKIIIEANEYGLLTDSTKVGFCSGMTRIEFAELAVKLYEKVYEKQINVSQIKDFADIKNDIARKARAMGVINGDENNNFNPYQKITRQEMAVILYNLFKKIYAILNIPFVNTYDGITAKYFKFSDGNKIKYWAQDAVGFMVSNEIMSGTGNNYFSPDEEAEKQQGVAVILKVLFKVRSINKSMAKLVEDAKVYNSTVSIKQYFEYWNAKLVLANSKKIIAIKSNKVILYTQGDEYICVNDTKDNIVSIFRLSDFAPIKVLNGDVRVSLDFAKSLENELSFIDIVNNYEDSNLYKSIKQIIMGEYTDTVTLEGTGGQLFLAFVGLDVPSDFRDICANFQNWEWSWGHAGNTALNVVSVVPIIGCIKYGDEAYVVFKHSDEVKEITKVSDLENAPEVTKFIENATNSELKFVDGKWISNNTENIGELNKIAEGTSTTVKSLGSKSEGYIAKRGWTIDTMNEVVGNPYTTREALNKATGNAATAYYNKAGDYVVVDNVTSELVQTSKFGDTGWIPDATIKNPYRP